MGTPQWDALRADAAVMHERFGVTLANGLGDPVAVELTGDPASPAGASAPASPEGPEG
jgi:hypothetical protein